MENLPKDPAERPPITEKLRDGTNRFLEFLGRKAVKDPEAVGRAAEQASTRVGRFKQAVQVAGLGLALLAVETQKEHSDTRYEITETKLPDGRTEFAHEDARTTQITKFLTGEAPLPPEDHIIFYHDLVLREFRMIYEVAGTEMDPAIQDAYASTLPTDIDKLRIELARLYRHQDLFVSQTIGAPFVEQDYMGRASAALEQVTNVPVTYDAEHAALLWKFQDKVGAPKIRWASQHDSPVADSVATHQGHGRPFYIHETNTVYLAPTDTRATLLAEAAHADQFNENPFLSRLRMNIDEAHIRYRAFKEGISRHSSQLREYDRVGSMEHEAHRVREDELKADLPGQ